MTIDSDVKVICATYCVAESKFAELVQSILNAEGNLNDPQAIVRAVHCSDDSVTTRDQAIRIVCRSAIHRLADWAHDQHAAEFTTYMGSFWAPLKATNDPHNLNANWAPNVWKLWTQI